MPVFAKIQLKKQVYARPGRRCPLWTAIAASLLVNIVHWLSPAVGSGQGLAFLGDGGNGSIGGEAFGAGDPYAEQIVPRIPEPMVFDLVRPLGARRGELEMNVLAEFPFQRRFIEGPPDALGLMRIGETEWAPEVEYAIFDNFAVEFELPFEDNRVAAWKGAAQWTIGTAFDDQFIHGFQFIGEYVVDPDVTEITALYLFGIRFDDYWSMLCMVGVRGSAGLEDPQDRAETIFNWSVFRDMTDKLTLGFETNYAAALSGDTYLMLMPQFHWEICDHWMLQAGSGVVFESDHTLPLAAMRGIYTF